MRYAIAKIKKYFLQFRNKDFCDQVSRIFTYHEPTLSPVLQPAPWRVDPHYRLQSDPSKSSNLLSLNDQDLSSFMKILFDMRETFARFKTHVISTIKT